MDIRRPSTDEVFGHYQRLVGEPELDVAACWAVVVPDDGLDSLPLPEVSARLGGGTSYELREVVKPHFVNLPLRRQGPCAVVDRSGAAVVLYGLDHLGYSSGALRRLSSNARVYSAWWNVNSVNCLSLTVNGEVLISIDGLFPGRPENHPNLASWPELTEAPRLRWRPTAAHNKERLKAGEDWTEHGLMFPTAFGNPSDPDTFSHLFSRLAKKAGLGHWHPHELRHSGASLMLAQGTPLHVVSEVLGHASIAITKDIYGHLLEGDRRAATEAISSALLGRENPVAPKVAPQGAEDTG
ncbi:tyrosine-type recombinase/integrase [Nonomuraea aridisoli]|uniref:tyrosine-type recombinase/integrase n=1 Tax=Nonomuraea aridisoli TaxID=2070368 RepID=UPI0015E88835|nr:site-specific integrase [Nonomuraea aridisoli]